MASRNNKSSGLRILWIPGGRKGHPKGRFDSTSKQPSYSSGQKKSQVWSLGGSKAQQDFLKADADTTLLDGPSTSGLVPVTCAIGAVGAATTCTTNALPSASDKADEVAADSKPTTETAAITPTTPNSTTSTAPLLSPPNSPYSPANSLDTLATDTMPARTTTTAGLPVIITTTTTAEIIDENRFSLLATKELSNDIDIYDLPSPPKDDLDLRGGKLLLNSSAGTTDSTATAQPSPSTSPKSDAKSNTDSSSGNVSPSKKKLHHRNHNNNHQSDVNSIESISDNVKIPSTDLDWIDDIMLERNGKELLQQKNKKKKKKKVTTTKEMDQLDGVPIKSNTSEVSADEDEKVVKCLYYTLMCCDCTIS